MFLTTKPVEIFKPGSTEPVTGYQLVLGVSDADCLAEEYSELEYFEVDASKTNNLSIFDLQHSLRIIDEKLKLHLESIELEGVYVVPTKEFGGTLANSLKWG